MNEAYTDLSRSFGHRTGGFMKVLRTSIHFTLPSPSMSRISVERSACTSITTKKAQTPRSLIIHRDQLLS